MKLIVCIATHFLVISVNTLWAQKTSQNNEIERLVDDYILPLEELDLFNGTVLIMKNDEVLVNKAYGFANEEHQVKNTPSTKFRIASLSKIFTKLAIIQLAEKNKLNLNDNLSQFIPDYPNGNKITISHLLNHSSGIPHINDFPDYDQLAKEHYSIEQVITLFKKKELDFEPGTKETYSNSGYVLLVYIIEKASGMNYGKYLDVNIFQPAAMRNSGHDTGTQTIKDLAKGYMMNLKGPGLQLPLYYNPTIKVGGGSLYSTTGDLYLFNTAYNGRKLSLSSEPLYDQGIYGRSPGYNSFMWEFDGIFISVLSNNYSTPIKQVAWNLSNLMLGKEFEIVKIKEYKSITSEELLNYEGDYKIGEDIETIESINGVLIEYENGDKWRGCRLIPIGVDIFFDTCYLETLTFTRSDKTKTINGFYWENGDSTVRISK